MTAQPLKLVEAGSLRLLQLQKIDIEIQCDAFLSRTLTFSSLAVRPATSLALSSLLEVSTRSLA